VQAFQANGDAVFPPDAVNYIVDGWLKLKKAPKGS
jgi:hypothetical protein